MTFCESYSTGCECRFFDSDTHKYLGFCREGELHPLSMPFAPGSVVKLGYFGEHPVVSISYDELEDSFYDPYGCEKRRALDLMRAIPNPQPWIQELIKNLEEEMSFE